MPFDDVQFAPRRPDELQREELESEFNARFDDHAERYAAEIHSMRFEADCADDVYVPLEQACVSSAYVPPVDEELPF